MSKEYEVRLNSGVEMEFYGDGSLETIDCKPNAVPDGIVPDAIATYVSTNFPQAFVVKYHIDRRKQEVELNNDLDLVFNLKGIFQYIDD